MQRALDKGGRDSLGVTGFRIGNFKPFGHTQNWPLRPLTLIFGANSAGKSSLIQSLLLARHLHQTGEIDVHKIKSVDEVIDLGGFRQFVHRHDPSLPITWGADISVASLWRDIPQRLFGIHNLNVDVQFGRKLGRASVQNIEIKADNLEFIRFGIPYFCEIPGHAGRRSEQDARIDSPVSPSIYMERLALEHPVIRRWLTDEFKAVTGEKLTDRDFASLNAAQEELTEDAKISVDNLLPERMDWSLLGHDSYDSLRSKRLRLSRSRRREVVRKIAKVLVGHIVDEVLMAVHRKLSSLFHDTSYLGPARAVPERHAGLPGTLAGASDATGGEAWARLRDDRSAVEAVNHWLGDRDKLATPYQIDIRTYAEVGAVIAAVSAAKMPLAAKEKMSRQVIKRLEREDERQGGNSVMRKLELIDRRTGTAVSHRDVGFGISQVLPVLVAACCTSSQFYAVEQPELHLHPRLQADLADVFIESALGNNGNTFLLETHSEHLILRIMRRIRQTSERRMKNGQTPVRPSDVSILYVDSGLNGSLIQEMPVNEGGELVKAWPGGFFEEGIREMLS